MEKLDCPKCQGNSRRLSDGPGVNGWIFYCDACEFIFSERYEPTNVQKPKDEEAPRHPCPECGGSLIAARRGKGYNVSCSKCDFFESHQGKTLKKTWDSYKPKNRYG